LEVAETAAYERQVAAKLVSPEGQAVYARRQSLVEPVIGNLKFNLGFSRFSMRGLARVKGEFLLLCIAHNLMKLTQWQGRRRMLAALCSSMTLVVALINRQQTLFRTVTTGGLKNRLALSFI